MNLQDVSDAFNIQASPEQLSGGSQPTFKVGNVVLKRVKETSLENNHSPELIQWMPNFPKRSSRMVFAFPRHFKHKKGNGSRKMDGLPGQLWREDTQQK